MEIIERRILRAITRVYRNQDGKYFKKEILYKAAGIGRNIRTELKEKQMKYEEMVANHMNETYRQRMDVTRYRREKMEAEEERRRQKIEWRKAICVYICVLCLCII